MPERSKWTMIGWAAVAALCILVAARALESRGRPEPPPVRVAGTGAASVRGSRDGRTLYVHVAGAVRRPGLMRVPPGARVAVAIERAGGPTRRAELAGVNLAAPLEDGQQIVVPRAGEGGGPPGTGVSAAAPGAGPVGGGRAAAAKLSLATATAEQLDALDGIGPTLARRILAFRDANGGFRSVHQLREVEGIGEKRYEALREAVRP